MVDILTDNGVFLDLDPAAEFEITIENPLLQEDRIPVPFSTAIAFLATPTNKAVFGYLDTVMLDPTVRKVGASILVGGIPLYTGTLVYDSIDEDGRINYTFSGKDLQTEWGMKIWETPGLIWPNYTYDALLAALKSDQIAGVHLPPVVDKALVGEPGFRSTPTGYRPGTGQVNYNQKYRNQPDALSFSEIVPAVEIGRILGAVVSFQSVSDADVFFQQAVVFGTNWSVGFPPTSNGGLQSYDIAKTLPDITLADLLLDVCRMFCAAVFQDGASFRMMPASDVLAAASPLDWDTKVSDTFRSSREEKTGYELDFEQDSSTSEQNSDVDVREQSSLTGVLGEAGDDYDAVKHAALEDLYSLKKSNPVQIKNLQDTSIGIAEEILIDRCDRTGAIQEADGTEQTKKVSIGLHLAKCAPVRRYWLQTTNVRTLRSDNRMAAILSLPAYGAERPTDVYIALYGNGQACDKGVVIANPDSASSADQTIGDSLAPEALFERYHQAYAAWLAKDRQLLSVDLDLSPSELAAFRMWQAVRVRSRNFLVSKLSVRVSASAGGVDVSADLLSL